MQSAKHHYSDRVSILRDIDQALSDSTESDSFACVVAGRILRTREIYFEMGYENGDALLEDLLSSVANCLRPKDIFARIDHHEFILILPGLKNTSQPLMAVNKIIRKCGVYEYDERELKIKISCGASIAPIEADNAEQLLRSADIALRHAETNELEYVRYTDCPVKTITPVLQLEAELESAIKGGDLDAVFQPVIDVESGGLTEIEILTRWTRGALGPIEPHVFIDIAERSGLTMPLTNWALNNALRECNDWQELLPRVRVSMNITTKALQDPHMPELMQRALNLWSTQERNLSIEVNESTIMADPELSKKVLRQLHEKGILIAIDNFGRGASSLSYLKELPLDVLKIDRSFVSGMIENSADRQIVQAVIDLAHNFNLSVVAKGVTDEETLDTLTLMGCQCAQGAHIGEAMDAAELPAWFDDSPWELLPDPNDTASKFAEATFA